MIEMIGVSKSYNQGAVRAVDDVTLTISNGEIFGFLGPNGAGKTTLIKMITGILNADTGSIKIN
ncbi:MAG: ATP-binding cassette domain-containing protein, partial [Syntrophomonas sp.]|nr:ATP-binding cassette domain-containing protein [Syntrophomonas sp.]